MKKFGNHDHGQCQRFLECEQLYEVMARLMIIFEDTKMIYFDYPNPQIIDSNKRNTIVTGIFKTKESMALKEATFTQGGPLRIFMSLLL